MKFNFWMKQWSERQVFSCVRGTIHWFLSGAARACKKNSREHARCHRKFWESCLTLEGFLKSSQVYGGVGLRWVDLAYQVNGWLLRSVPKLFLIGFALAGIPSWRLRWFHRKDFSNPWSSTLAAIDKSKLPIPIDATTSIVNHQALSTT